MIFFLKICFFKALSEMKLFWYTQFILKGEFPLACKLVAAATVVVLAATVSLSAVAVVAASGSGGI